MADFVRTFCPDKITFPSFPVGYESWSIGGKGMFRACIQAGREWTETYGLMPQNNSNTQKFLAYLYMLAHSKQSFTIDHPDIRLLSNVTGAFKVNGSNQTGTTINVTNSLSGTLPAGTAITFSNSTLVYTTTSDVTGGTMSIYPPIFAGVSPVDGSDIKYKDNKFTAVITGDVKVPARSGGDYYSGLVVNFKETP